MGALLEKIEGKAVVAQKARLDFQGLALSPQACEFGSPLLHRLPSLVREQQAAIAGQSVKRKKEDQESERGGWQIGLELEQHWRLASWREQILRLSLAA
jgi:hypothetical protein